MANDTFNLDKERLIKQSFVEMDKHLQGTDYSPAQKLALTCRILFDNGHDSGLAGQITARGETPGTYLTQRLGFGFDEICASNLLLVNEDLEVLQGDGMAISPIVSFVAYRARPMSNALSTPMQCILRRSACWKRLWKSRIWIIACYMTMLLSYQVAGCSGR